MGSRGEYENTWCNPLPLPDIPQGSDVDGFCDYRDAADPTVIWYKEKWILYATTGGVYESSDYCTWHGCKGLKIPELSAPTVCEYRGGFLMMGSNSPLYEAQTPFGPFEERGMITGTDGAVFSVRDPMLFADRDGKLYLYWGLGKDGIYGMELDPEDCTRAAGNPVSLIRYDRDHVWERFGAWNQNEGLSFIEGAWMLRREDTYYLIYSACGTNYRTYGWGVYKSSSPLEGFVYQERNPVLLKKYGLVCGTGHGSVVQGPEDTLWAFYTIKVCHDAKYERRIAMDPAGIDENGDLFVTAVSEIPKWAPGVKRHPGSSDDAGLLPLTWDERVKASSLFGGREASYAVDGSMGTWWQPADEDESPHITVDLRAVYTVSAMRVIIKSIGISYQNGRVPQAFGYLLEGSTESRGPFQTILDGRDNTRELEIDYRTFESVKARHVRLTITKIPSGIRPGVVDFTVFGRYSG